MEKLKVLIVEDEFLIRELLKNYVNVQNEFFEIAGEASSAAEALDFLDERYCDIIITDINMPVLNGIEMIKRIFEVKPYGHIKVIVVTGYDNFDYAQKCIKIGVEDYLLKPVNEKDFIESIYKTRDKIIRKRKKDLEYKEITKQITEYMPYLAEAFFNEIITKKLDSNYIKEKLLVLKIHIKEEYFQIAIINKINETPNQKKELFDLFAFKNIICENFKNTYVFFDNKNRIVMLSCLNSMDILVDYEYLKTIMVNSLDCDLNMGIGSVVFGLENIVNSHMEAEQVINYSSFLDGNGIVFYEELGIIEEKNKVIIKIEEEELARLEFYLKGGLLQNAEEWVDKNFYYELENIENLRIKALQVLVRVHSINAQLHKILNDRFEDVFYLQTFYEIKKFLCDLILNVISYFNKIRNNTVTNMMKSIEEYIDENLSNKSLSLSGTAKHFYINASYLSRMFKQRQSISFRDYISKKRIEKALEYLCNTEVKAYEIGAMVGIDDPNYFSTLFKKYTGMTITKYRRKI